MMLPNDESSPCCQDEAIKTRFAKATPRKTPNKVEQIFFELPSQIMRDRVQELTVMGDHERI
jgi:hypothetical protein